MTKVIKDYANAAMRAAGEEASVRGLVGNDASVFMFGFMCGAIGVTAPCESLTPDAHTVFNSGWEFGGAFSEARVLLDASRLPPI